MTTHKTTTWLFAAALLVSAAQADAAPPGEKDLRESGWENVSRQAKPAPRVDPNSLRWTSHSGTRSPTTLFDPKYTGAAEGTVEEVIDGHIILSTPLSDEARKKIAARTGRPLSAVPDRNVRRLRIMEDGPSEASLRAQIGEKLRLELKRDVRGNMFVTRIEKKLGPGLTPNGAFKDLRKPTR